MRKIYLKSKGKRKVRSPNTELQNLSLERHLAKMTLRPKGISNNMDIYHDLCINPQNYIKR
jgi:hypothetical protein